MNQFSSYKVSIKEVSEPYFPAVHKKFRYEDTIFPQTNLLHILNIYTEQTTVACIINYLRWAESCAVRFSSPNIETGFNHYISLISYEASSTKIPRIPGRAIIWTCCIAPAPELFTFIRMLVRIARRHFTACCLSRTTSIRVECVLSCEWNKTCTAQFELNLFWNPDPNILQKLSRLARRTYWEKYYLSPLWGFS